MENNYNNKRENLINWIENRRYRLDEEFPPVGREFERADTPKVFNRLSIDEQVALVGWVLMTLKPIKNFNEMRTSYGIKHIFGHAPLGFYVFNGAMKGAMLIAGYRPKNEREVNWVFNVSERSVRQAYRFK